jgi:hypothetical protein
MYAAGRNNTIEEEDEGEPVSLVVVGNKIDLKEGGMDHVCEVTREMVRGRARAQLSSNGGGGGG